MKKYIPAAFVSLIVIFIIISNLIWLKTDTVPQRWDESIHLIAATGFAKAIAQSPAAAIKTFITQES